MAEKVKASRYEALMRKLEGGQCVLIDGGTGTEVERRGVPQLDGAWNGGAALTHPEILQDVHADYLDLGARIVISNTFATGRHTLEPAGLEAGFELYNRRGVEIAVAAREASGHPQALVAGGISHWWWLGDPPTDAVLEANVAEQAAIMRDAGADLIMLEMMSSVDRMVACYRGARASGLPVWVGFSSGPDEGAFEFEDGVPVLRDGDLLVDALAALAETDAPVVSVMHTDVTLIDACLDVMAEHWDRAIGVYAHSGRYIDDQWIVGSSIEPEDYGRYAERWLGKGVQVLGSCCGTGPEHIAHLASRFSAQLSAEATPGS